MKKTALPEKINASWLATLANNELVEAEAALHKEFIVLETVEKKISGSRYTLLEGPAPLVHAWLRWGLVSNETRSRGLVVRHARA